MKNNVCLFMAALVVTAFPICALSAPYSGGDGSPENPYQIANTADLLALGADTDNYDKCFILTADIDLAGETFTTAVINSTMDTPFTGVFDGYGHKISNLTIEGAGNSYVGLFGYLGLAGPSGPVGQIINLGVVNANISADDDVGILTGENDHGVIQYCYATGSVSGANYVGGLVGESYYGRIFACYSKANVSGTGDNIGGLAGQSNTYGVQDMIACCYATGTVTGTGPYIGGLAGFADPGTISCCFWDNQTSGQTGSPGGKGLSTTQMKTMSIYQNAGWAARSWVMNNGADYPRLWWENMGGIPIPSAPAIPLAGSGTAADPYRVTTAQEFASLSWYPGVLDKYIQLMANLDLNGIAVDAIGDLGTFKGVFDGKGHTLSNITINQLGGEYVGVFAYVGPGGQIRNFGILDANIQGYRFVGGIAGYINGAAIDSCWATGSVSGIERVGGLAGYSMNSANTACHTANSVNGSNVVGGLIGEGYTGTITRCYATGSVNTIDGGGSIGGLIGHNGSTITSSYAAGAVTGTGWAVGGLAGFNWGDIEFCYATGPVSGISSVGGLIGRNSASIFYCYATGSVNGNSSVGGLAGSGDGTSDRCFWDKDTSGQSASASDAIGKKTAEMKTLSTFTSAGWDFSATDGDPADWWMPANSYPQLAWQSVIPGDIAGSYGVNYVDFAVFAAHWGQTGCPAGCGNADINNSGTVDIEDLTLFADNWLKGV
jgi:hypothetical protein